MSLKETVHKQVSFMGKTPGGCKLVIHDLLDNGRNIFQFMQLFDEAAIEKFYYTHAIEIGELCAEDSEMLTGGVSMCECTKHALEKTLMIIEGEIKNGKRD